MKTIYTISNRNQINRGIRRSLILTVGVILTISNISCESFVEIDPPRTELVKSTVFSSDVTAEAAMIEIYNEIGLTGFASGSKSSVSWYADCSSDIYTNFETYSSEEYLQFSRNQLQANNSWILRLWSDIYKTIYKTNAVIEGVKESSGLTNSVASRLEGEAKFIRAFSYFYLLNLFGEVPLILSTDYKDNTNVAKSTAQEIYQQIVADLIDGQNLLPLDYSFANDERVRANSWAATSLLARVYLYLKDWSRAEIEATKIIKNTSLFSLQGDLSMVFRANNPEAILQFHTTFVPSDFLTFRVFSSGPTNGAFRPEFIANFEMGDNRLTKWARNKDIDGITYYYPGKYVLFSTEDYSTVFRLSELLLIRAEARAQQNNIYGSQSDLNVIRNRAGLGDNSDNNTSDLLEAIYQERFVELFTEHGHRWMDLKRTGRVDDVMGTIPGREWQPTDALYPIPEYQIQNSTLTQNLGY